MYKLPQSTLTLREPFCFEGSNGHVRGTRGVTNAPHTTAGALKLEPLMIGASTNDWINTTTLSYRLNACYAVFSVSLTIHVDLQFVLFSSGRGGLVPVHSQKATDHDNWLGTSPMNGKPMSRLKFFSVFLSYM